MAIDFHRREASLFRSQFLAGEVEGNILSEMTCSDQISSFHKPSSGFESASRSLSSQESEFAFSETETEKDDDYITELARQMAHNMLLDDDEDITEEVLKSKDFIFIFFSCLNLYWRYSRLL